jgi:hypothetical protein
MPIADPALGLWVIILGILLIIGGIAVAAVVYREGREWKNKIMPLLDMLDLGLIVPTLGGLAPMLLAFIKERLERVFIYVDVVGLLGGAAVSIVGIIVLIMGICIAG